MAQKSLEGRSWSRIPLGDQTVSVEGTVGRPEFGPLTENLDVGDQMFCIMRQHLSVGFPCVGRYRETLCISHWSCVCPCIFCLLKSCSNCGDRVSPLFRIHETSGNWGIEGSFTTQQYSLKENSQGICKNLPGSLPYKRNGRKASVEMRHISVPHSWDVRETIIVGAHIARSCLSCRRDYKLHLHCCLIT